MNHSSKVIFVESFEIYAKRLFILLSSVDKCAMTLPEHILKPLIKDSTYLQFRNFIERELGYPLSWFDMHMSPIKQRSLLDSLFGIDHLSTEYQF